MIMGFSVTEDIPVKVNFDLESVTLEITGTYIYIVITEMSINVKSRYIETYMVSLMVNEDYGRVHLTGVASTPNFDICIDFDSKEMTITAANLNEIE